jgi:ubiquinone/menaquinone biosynthesis C-methylase UbiE
MLPDYSTVTEITGNKVTREQLSRINTRYRFASEWCVGKDVLEVACGAGLGLGYLAAHAGRVVGGDIDEKILTFARQTYNGRKKIALSQFDAHNLPFRDRLFDVVILFEAIYYLAGPERFIAEARRVLRNEGTLIICTANKDRAEFNPSPYSHEYFSAPQLFQILQESGFRNIELYGDCPVRKDGAKNTLLSVLQRTAVYLDLIPRTMKGKEYLKRVFMGKLLPLPSELDEGISEYSQPVRIPGTAPVSNFKVLYAVARR